jgi:hypothetical protein
MEILTDFKIPITVLHVISVVFGMGGALMSDILFSFFSKDKKLNPTEISTLSILANVVFYSLFLIVLSGLMLFFTNPDKYMDSTKFLAKMSILGILLINGYVLNKYIWSHLIKKGFFVLKEEKNMRRVAFVCGAISVISWLSVCALGVLDSLNMAYTTIVSIYIVIIIFGTLVALLVEKRELN